MPCGSKSKSKKMLATMLGRKKYAKAKYNRPAKPKSSKK